MWDLKVMEYLMGITCCYGRNIEYSAGRYGSDEACRIFSRLYIWLCICKIYIRYGLYRAIHSFLRLQQSLIPKSWSFVSCTAEKHF